LIGLFGEGSSGTSTTGRAGVVLGDGAGRGALFVCVLREEVILENQDVRVVVGFIAVGGAGLFFAGCF
jgi:hypothetical protein